MGPGYFWLADFDMQWYRGASIFFCLHTFFCVFPRDLNHVKKKKSDQVVDGVLTPEVCENLGSRASTGSKRESNRERKGEDGEVFDARGWA